MTTTGPEQTSEDALIEAAAVFAAAAQARAWCTGRRAWVGAAFPEELARYEATYRATLAALRRAVAACDTTGGEG